MTFSQQDFETKLETFVVGAQKIIDDWHSLNNYSLPTPKLSVQHGKRYAKIVRTDSQTSVHCFVDKTNGDVLKASGWKAPAKGARGNIFNDDNGLCGVTQWGGRYL